MELLITDRFSYGARGRLVIYGSIDVCVKKTRECLKVFFTFLDDSQKFDMVHLYHSGMYLLFKTHMQRFGAGNGKAEDLPAGRVYYFDVPSENADACIAYIDSVRELPEGGRMYKTRDFESTFSSFAKA